MLSIIIICLRALKETIGNDEGWFQLFSPTYWQLSSNTEFYLIFFIVGFLKYGSEKIMIFINAAYVCINIDQDHPILLRYKLPAYQPYWARQR